MLDHMTLAVSFLLGPLGAVLLIWWWGIEKVASVSAESVVLFATLVIPSASFALTDTVTIPLSRVNTLIPLAENWVMMLAYLHIAGVWLMIRIVKSFIPTVAN